MGNFFVPIYRTRKRHFVVFAAGSGITPLLSIVKTTLVAEPQSSFTLFYGNRASASVMFREELAALKDVGLPEGSEAPDLVALASSRTRVSRNSSAVWGRSTIGSFTWGRNTRSGRRCDNRG